MKAFIFGVRATGAMAVAASTTTGIGIVATATRAIALAVVGMPGLKTRKGMRVVVFSGVERSDQLMAILIRSSGDRGELGARWSPTT